MRFVVSALAACIGIVPAQLRSQAAPALARVHEMTELLATTADSGAVMYALAERWLEAGRKDQALLWLRRVAALHQGYDPSGDERWAGLSGDAQFQGLIAEIRSSIPVVHRSEPAL